MRLVAALAACALIGAVWLALVVFCALAGPPGSEGEHAARKWWKR